MAKQGFQVSHYAVDLYRAELAPLIIRYGVEWEIKRNRIRFIHGGKCITSHDLPLSLASVRQAVANLQRVV